MKLHKSLGILLYIFAIPCFALGEGKILKVMAPIIPPVTMSPTEAFPYPGFQVEILERSLTNLGFQYEIEFVPFKRLTRTFRQKDADIILCVSRRQSAGWVHPEISTAPNQVYLIARADNNFEYKGVSSLKNMNLYVISGHGYADNEIDAYLKKMDNPKVFRLYGEDAHLRQLKLLLTGRADLIGFGDFPFHYLLRKYGFNRKDFRMVYRTGVFQNIIAVNPETPEAETLSKNITSEYRKLRKSGELVKLLSKYGIPLWEESLEKLQ